MKDKEVGFVLLLIELNQGNREVPWMECLNWFRLQIMGLFSACVCHCRCSAKCKSRQFRASCGGSDKGLTAQIPIGLIMTGPRLCYCSIGEH
jgi:hypothetical protein